MDMSNQLVDAEIGNPNLSSMGLSAKELQALGNHIEPSNTLKEFQGHDTAEQAALERYNLQRVQAENERLQAQLGQTTAEVQSMQQNYAHLTGQLSAMQTQQQAPTEEYRFTEAELADHGEILPVVEKVVKKSNAEIERMIEQRMETEKAKWQAEATQPLIAKLNEIETNQAVIQQREAKDFETEIVDYVQDSLGFEGGIKQITDSPEFQARYNTPVYPGASEAWGDALTRELKNNNRAAAKAMLKDFRDNHTNFQPPRQDTVVPTGGNPVAAPMTSTQSQNLDKRTQLLSIYQNRMEQANRGVFPPGMDRQSYKRAQAEILQQIDMIPTE